MAVAVNVERRGEFGVAGALMAVDDDAALFQQLAKEASGKLGGLFDGERLGCAGIVERQISPESDDRRAGLAIHKKSSPRAGGSGDDAIVDAVVIGERVKTDESFFAGTVGGQNFHEDYIVIHGERGNRRAIGPDEIVLAPAFAVTLESKIGIVGDNVAVDKFHALLHERVGERFEGRAGHRRCAAFCRS